MKKLIVFIAVVCLSFNAWSVTLQPLETNPINGVVSNLHQVEPNGKIVEDSLRKELDVYFSYLKAPKVLVGFNKIGTGTSENGWETKSQTGRVWTYYGVNGRNIENTAITLVCDKTITYLSTPDSDDLSFGNNVTDKAVSFGAWVKMIPAGAQYILSKYVAGGREYSFYFTSGEQLQLQLFSQGGSTNQIGKYTTAALTGGLHFVVATYSGSSAVTGIKLYVDGDEITTVTDGSVGAAYVAMSNGTSLLTLGELSTGSGFWQGSIGRTFITQEELSADTIKKMYDETRGFYGK